MEKVGVSLFMDKLGGSRNWEAADSVEVSYQNFRRGHNGGSDELVMESRAHPGDYPSPDGFRAALCLTFRDSDLEQSGAFVRR